MKIPTLFLAAGLLTATVASAQPEVYAYFEDPEVPIDCSIGLGGLHFGTYLSFYSENNPTGVDSARATIIRSTYAIESFMAMANLDMILTIEPGYYRVLLQAFNHDGTIGFFQTDLLPTNFCQPLEASAEAFEDTICGDMYTPVKFQINTDKGLPMLVDIYHDGSLYFHQERHSPLDTVMDVMLGEYEMLVKEIDGLDTAYADTAIAIDYLCGSTSISAGQNEESAIRAYPNPASTEITVTTDAQEFDIVDATGRIVEHRKVFSHEAVRLDVSGYVPGMYFVKTSQKILRFTVSR